MKIPRVTKQEMTHVDGQIKVQIFPKKKAPKSHGIDNSKFDIIRLVLTAIEGSEQELYMTPDEALAIASALTTSVQFYLLAGSKGYREEILNPRNRAGSMRGRRKCK